MKKIKRPIPGTGWGYSSVDFVAGETYTHAQSCRWLLGYSDLGDALLRGVDPHGAIAATTLGISYEEWFKRRKEPMFKAARQGVKPITFGRPTGMSPKKIVLSARAQGQDTPCARGPSMIDDPDRPGKKIPGFKGTRFCILMNNAEYCGGPGRMANTWGKWDQKIPPTCRECLECAEHLSRMWMRQWSENQPYYDLNQGIVEDGMEVTEEMLERWPWLRQVYRAGMRTQPAQVIQHWSGTLRLASEKPFTTLCNGWFQVLLGDIMKLAWRMICREAFDRTVKVPKLLFPNSLPSKYAGATSPLLGSRPIAPLHDEAFCAHPDETLVDGAHRNEEIMRDAFRWVCPDMADGVGAEACIQKRWYKLAEPVFRNAVGKLCKKDDPGARLSIWRPKIGPDAMLE